MLRQITDGRTDRDETVCCFIHRDMIELSQVIPIQVGHRTAQRVPNCASFSAKTSHIYTRLSLCLCTSVCLVGRYAFDAIAAPIVDWPLSRWSLVVSFSLPWFTRANLRAKPIGAHVLASINITMLLSLVEIFIFGQLLSSELALDIETVSAETRRSIPAIHVLLNASRHKQKITTGLVLSNALDKGETLTLK